MRIKSISKINAGPGRLPNLPGPEGKTNASKYREILKENLMQSARELQLFLSKTPDIQ